MTSDDELLELIKEKFDALAFRQGTPQHAFCESARNEVMPLVERQAARIRELKAELSAWRVGNPDHVVVPVEPTIPMIKAGWRNKDHLATDTPSIMGIYRAMIRAAQGATGGVSSAPEQEGSP